MTYTEVPDGYLAELSQLAAVGHHDCEFCSTLTPTSLRQRALELRNSALGAHPAPIPCACEATAGWYTAPWLL